MNLEKIFLSPKIKINMKYISLQVQKLTRSCVQILGFEYCHKAKILPYTENITQIHFKTMEMICQNKSDQEIYKSESGAFFGHPVL